MFDDQILDEELAPEIDGDEEESSSSDDETLEPALA